MPMERSDDRQQGRSRTGIASTGWGRGGAQAGHGTRLHHRALPASEGRASYRTFFWHEPKYSTARRRLWSCAPFDE